MFACIHVPDFPVEAIVRVEPLLRERAVAVLDGKPPLQRVIALNEKARLRGMEAGMTKLQAAVFAAPEGKNSSILRRRLPQQENSAHSALLDVAHGFTPRVEDTAADTLLLDLAGMGRLYGTPEKIARSLASQVSALGLEANVALADNPDAAMYAARGFRGITVIPVGKESQRLGALPLPVLLKAFELLPNENSVAEYEREKLCEQVLETLERWGVRDFRGLAMLPDDALASRLGEVGTHLQRLARGAGMRTLVLCRPSSRFQEMIELESPIETLEPLSFILNRLLEQLCARLKARALAAQELHLRLQLERRIGDEEATTPRELAANYDNVGYTTFERTLRLPVAMREARVFLKLLQLELAAHPPGAPITKACITAEPAPPRSAQLGLFLPISPEPERLEITLARIRGVVGECRAGIANLLDSHRPDSFRMERFVVAPRKSKFTKHPELPDNRGVPRLALRSFRPPWPLRVELSGGRPHKLTSVPKRTNRGQLKGTILWSSGPWRSSGDWWMENSEKSCSGSFDREEWDVALAIGNGTDVALYRVYRDRMSGHWFADASYD